LLIYDAESLIVLNRAAESVDLSRVSFVQTLPDGGIRRFEGAQWTNGGLNPAGVLAAGDCFQIWTLTTTDLPVPAECGAQQAWRMVGETRSFWLPVRDDARPNPIFEVRRGTVILARCPLRVPADARGECALTP